MYVIYNQIFSIQYSFVKKSHEFVMSTKSIYKKEKPGPSSEAGVAQSSKEAAEKAETSTETGYVDHKEAHYKDIASLFHRDEFQDVTFVVEGRRFSAHKAVLA